MAEGDITFFNNAKEQLFRQSLGDFQSVTFRMTLHTGYTLDIDGDAVWSDVSATEYGTANGYTAGGITLSNVSITQNNTANAAYFDADDAQFSSIGPLSGATPSHAICRIDNSTDPLIFAVELGATPTNGGNYTIQFNTTGIASLS